jgi:hypothetical protein
MSAPGGVVLAATLVVSSPIVWLLHEGQLTLEDAALRWLMCLALCRVAISVVSSVAYPSVRPPAAPADAAGPPAAEASLAPTD